MPALFSLGQQSALEAIPARLRPSERLMAFSDDIHGKSDPDQSASVFTAIQEELLRVGIRVHDGRTQLWNRSGVVPTRAQALTEAAQRLDREAIVWRGRCVSPSTGARCDGLGDSPGTS